MGWLCGTQRGGIEMHTEFWWGNLDKRHHCGKLGIDGREI